MAVVFGLQTKKKEKEERSSFCVSESVGRDVAAVPDLLSYLCGFQNPLTYIVLELFIPRKAQGILAIG